MAQTLTFLHFNDCVQPSLLMVEVIWTAIWWQATRYPQLLQSFALELDLTNIWLSHQSGSAGAIGQGTFVIQDVQQEQTNLKFLMPQIDCDELHVWGWLYFAGTDVFYIKYSLHVL